MHVKPDPVTEICFVCSASAAVRAQPRSEPPGMCSVMVRQPGPAASLASETAALAPRPMQLWIVALQPTCAEPSDPSIGTRWPTALVVVAITPAASHAAPGAHHTKPPAAPTRTRAPSATACSSKGRRA